MGSLVEKVVPREIGSYRYRVVEKIGKNTYDSVLIVRLYHLIANLYLVQIWSEGLGDYTYHGFCIIDTVDSKTVKKCVEQHIEDIYKLYGVEYQRIYKPKPKSVEEARS